VSHRTPAIQIVVTPGSGEGRASALASRALRVLRARGRRAGILSFRELDSLTRWARTCDAAFSHLVAVGGDATLSEAAGAAVRLSVPFLPLPCGFGNLFGRAFEYPRDPEAAVDLIERGDLAWVDAGQAQGELFLSHRSFGLLARIQETVERARRDPHRRSLRLLAYYRMGIKRLAETALDRIDVEVDGHAVPGPGAVVTVANVETYRGFLSLTPAASPLDGLLDVCVVPRTSKRGVLAQLIRMMLELPGCRSDVAIYRGRSIRVRVHRRKPEDVRVLAGVLPVLVPAHSLARLAARQAGAEVEAPVTTPALQAPAALVHALPAARALRARSRRPA
jgi:diacylglycerol kinase (ATP)